MAEDGTPASIISETEFVDAVLQITDADVGCIRSPRDSEEVQMSVSTFKRLRRRMLAAGLLALILGGFAASSVVSAVGSPRPENPTAATAVEYGL
jgi:hypothetical protein